MSVISSFSVVYRIGWRNAENYSEIVEISSEPVEISSALVLQISELLKISTFKKSPIVVSRTPVSVPRSNVPNIFFIYIFCTTSTSLYVVC